VDWIFEGLGTMIIGLVIGGAAGTGITWRVMSKKLVQRQVGGDNAQQIQAGRDVKGKGP